MYWAITTLTATGYGDIVPVNTSERIIATITFVIGASLFGYVTANVTEVVSSFGRAEQVANFSMARINEYLVKFNINRSLRIDVVDHSRQVPSLTYIHLIYVHVHPYSSHSSYSSYSFTHMRLFHAIVHPYEPTGPQVSVRLRRPFHPLAPAAAHPCGHHSAPKCGRRQGAF